MGRERSHAGAARHAIKTRPNERILGIYDHAVSAALPDLTIDLLKEAAKGFAELISVQEIPSLYGVDNGKTVGTFVEATFNAHLALSFTNEQGNAAKGIDFPSLGVDLKVTSKKQPQSSSPFRDATQKVYGLGYHLLVFVYDKSDDPTTEAARLKIDDLVFVRSDRTADFQTTNGIRFILENDGNLDDLDAFIQERNLPLDDIGRRALAERILTEPPQVGFLTLSNALQWRLQYGRAITMASRGNVDGVENLYAE